MIRQVIFIASLTALTLRLWFTAFPPYEALSLTLSASGPAGTYYFLYSDSSEYSAANAVKSSHRGGSEFQTHSVHIPAGKLKHLRIDPGTATGTVRFKTLCLSKAKASPTTPLCFEGKELASILRPRRGISKFSSAGDSVNIEVADGWAYVETVPGFTATLTQLTRKSLLSSYLLTPILCAAIVLLFTLLTWHLAAIEISRTKALLTVVALIVPLSLFFIGVSVLERTTPLFQGPDEPDHLAKLISVQEGFECPLAPKRMERAVRTLSHLPHHPDRTLTTSDLEQLFNRPYKSGKKLSTELGSNACAYSPLYVAGPAALNKLLGVSVKTTHPTRYSAVSRLGVRIIATALWGCCLLLLLYGSGMSKAFEHTLPAIRVAGFLTTLYMMFIPQTMWLSAVVSQDYLLIPLGLIAILSTFFRIRIFSDFLLLLALVAGASKVVYLIQLIPCVLLHYGTLRYGTLSGLLRSTRNLLLSSLVTALTVFLAGKAFIQQYCTANNCYGIETAGVFHSLAGFPVELFRIVNTLGAMHIPEYFHTGSAFAHLGWLDTSIPDGFGVLYGSAATTVFVLSLVLLPAGLLVDRGFWSKSLAYTYGRNLLLWLAGLVAVYFSVVIMGHWCGVGSEFGCGYQRRYALPVYGVVPFSLFLLPLVLASSQESLTKRGLFFVPLATILICIQALAATHAYQASTTALGERYFDSTETKNRYQRLLHAQLYPNEATLVSD